MTTTVPADTLERLIRACFEGVGLSPPDAGVTAEALLYANLRGIDSHGLERVPVFMRSLKSGVSAGSERISVIARRGALCRLDAAHCLGPPAGVKAMDEAVGIARSQGAGLVAMRNSTNFGAAGFYALRAARQGLIGVVTSNAPKLMAPHGAIEPFLGSNPLAVAVPMGDRVEFVLDMSSTVVARGKLRRAEALGQPVEPGLALNARGEETTDPAEALAGALLPFAGAKGSGLAFAITLLGGLLAGADFDDEVASIYREPLRRQNLGQLFLAIDPSPAEEREQAFERLGGLVDRLHALHVPAGCAAPTYPGEGAATRERERRRAGVPVETVDLEAVARACSECGLRQLADDVGALLTGSV